MVNSCPCINTRRLLRLASAATVPTPTGRGARDDLPCLVVLGVGVTTQERARSRKQGLLVIEAWHHSTAQHSTTRQVPCLGNLVAASLVRWPLYEPNPPPPSQLILRPSGDGDPRSGRSAPGERVPREFGGSMARSVLGHPPLVFSLFI